MNIKMQFWSYCLIILVTFFGTSCTQKSLSKDSGRTTRSQKLKRTKIVKKKRRQDFLKSKEAKKIYQRQGQRLQDINSYKKRGLIGESTIGTLLIRTPKGLSKTEFRKMKNLVGAENRDRNRIYFLISKQSKYDQNKSLGLRKNMFKTRLDLDPVGTYYYRDRYWIKK